MNYTSKGHCHTHGIDFFDYCPLCLKESEARKSPTPSTLSSEIGEGGTEPYWRCKEPWPRCPKQCPECAAQPTDIPATGEMPAEVKPTFAEYIEGRSGGLLAVQLLAEYEKAFGEMETSDERTFRKAAQWYLNQLRECQQEITQLKASLEESRNDAKVFQEWYKTGDANVIALTEQLEIAQEERNAYEVVLKELFDALDFEGKSVVAPVLDKYKKTSK